MSDLSLQEIQAVSDLASALYSFLPGSVFAPSGIRIDFGTVANSVGVGHLWVGGSKKPAIEQLLEGVLQRQKSAFCPLMINITKEGIKYRKRKGNPVTKEEILKINELIAKLGFKIPELHDPKFILTLSSAKINPEQKTDQKAKDQGDIIKKLVQIKELFINITQLPPKERGFAFEKFLHDFFDIYNFIPRPSFRNLGEQIDGSIQFEHQTYLFEAKWQDKAITESDILVLDGRVQGHSTIGRGIFITAGCFSPDGITAYQRLRPSSIIGIDGQDLFFILDRTLPLDEVLRMKIRRLIETGEFYYPVAMMSLKSIAI